VSVWTLLDRWSALEERIDPNGLNMKIVSAGYAAIAGIVGYGVSLVLRAFSLLDGPAVYDVYIGCAVAAVGFLLRFANAVRHQIIGDHTPQTNDRDHHG
jgi:hypothetical protein